MVDEARAGRGGLVLVTGEAGIGKTRLVEELLAGLDPTTATVVWGRCHEGAAAPALWPWPKVVRSLASGREGGAAMATAAAEYALDVLSETSSQEPSGLAQSDGARFRLFSGVASLLAAAAGQVSVVAIDDLQWADSSALRLIRFLADELRSSRALIVATWRDTDGAEGAAAVLGELMSRAAAVVALAGLDADDVAGLMAATTGTPTTVALADAVRARTGGNPLFVREVARLLAGRDVASLSALAVPEGVRAVIDRRVARLSQPCHDLLNAAAVLGEGFGVEVLGRMSGVSVDEAVARLDEALAAKLVGLGADPGWLRFDHALVRDAIYAGIGLPRRLRLHLAAGEALAESAGDDPAALAAIAYHFHQAIPLADTERAVRFSTRAAERSRSVLAYEDAASHFRRALGLLDAGRASQRLELLLALGDSLIRVGELPEARIVFAEAAGLARGLSRPDALAEAALGFGSGLGGFEVRLFDDAQLHLLDEALAALPPDDSSLRARTLARLSVALSFVADQGRRLLLSEQAVAMARRLGDRVVVGYALAGHCDAIAGPEHSEARLDESVEIIEVAIANGDRRLELLGRRHRLVALLEVGDVDGVDAEIERFSRTAESLREPLYRWYVPLWRGMRALMEGRVDDVERWAAHAEALGRAAHSDNAAMLVPVLRGVGLVEQGRPDGLGQQWSAFAGADFAAYTNAAAAVAWMKAVCGDHAGARAAMAPLVARSFATVPRDSEWLAFGCELAETIALLGDDDAAAALYPLLAPLADRFGVEGIAAACWGSLHRPAGLLCHVLGRWDDAESHYRQALDANRRAGATLLVADTQLAYATLLYARGRVDTGDELAAEAERTFQAMGLERRAASARALRPARQTPAAANVIRRDGPLWSISYHGTTVALPDAKGLRDLAVLLASPGRAVPAVELMAAGAVSDTPRGARTARPDLAAAGHAGEVLDARARREYQARVGDLREEIDEAEANADLERAARARAELDLLVAELAGAVGLGGRPRRAGDPAERARTAVAWRLRDAIRRVEAVHPALGRHLKRSVRTGALCGYDPEPPEVWSRS